MSRPEEQRQDSPYLNHVTLFSFSQHFGNSMILYILLMCFIKEDYFHLHMCGFDVPCFYTRDSLHSHTTLHLVHIYIDILYFCCYMIHMSFFLITFSLCVNSQERYPWIVQGSLLYPSSTLLSSGEALSIKYIQISTKLLKFNVLIVCQALD